MKIKEKLKERIKRTDSRLCIGLDPRKEFIEGDILKYLVRVVKDTCKYAAAYKPNIAYFEALGRDGLSILYELLNHIPSEIPVILDAKRSDIPETQTYYAKTYFEDMKVDAVTLNPYLGKDSIEPFLKYKDKGVYLLGITSNKGSEDIQKHKTETGMVFEKTFIMADELNKENGFCGLVIGSTTITDEDMRKIPDVPLLVPGVGSQGGKLFLISLLCKKMKNPILVNVSRKILYVKNNNFETAAKEYKELINNEFKR